MDKGFVKFYNNCILGEHSDRSLLEKAYNEAKMLDVMTMYEYCSIFGVEKRSNIDINISTLKSLHNNLSLENSNDTIIMRKLIESYLDKDNTKSELNDIETVRPPRLKFITKKKIGNEGPIRIFESRQKMEQSIETYPLEYIKRSTIYIIYVPNNYIIDINDEIRELKHNEVIRGLFPLDWMRGKLGSYGGKVGPDENFIDTAIRELKEEQGIEIDANRLHEIQYQRIGKSFCVDYNLITEDWDEYKNWCDTFTKGDSSFGEHLGYGSIPLVKYGNNFVFGFPQYARSSFGKLGGDNMCIPKFFLLACVKEGIIDFDLADKLIFQSYESLSKWEKIMTY